LIQSAEKENKMKDLTFLLEESRDKANQLEEKTSKNTYKNMRV
jgi:synaptonemal complex protein 1